MKRVQKAQLTLAVMLCLSASAQAAPPDLTTGGVPGDTVTINLGPTGTRGWVYHVRTNTGESRQIQVKVVTAGSPADGRKFVRSAGRVRNEYRRHDQHPSGGKSHLPYREFQHQYG